MKTAYGWEFAEKGSHFLTYGLGVDWLCANEDCDKLSTNEYCDRVHASGGFIVQAHPFRTPGKRDMIRLLPHKVDAVEIVNASRMSFENQMAALYAAQYSLCRFCGSDTHSTVIPRLAAIGMEMRAASAADILAAVIRGECAPILLARGEAGVWYEVNEFTEE